VNGGGWFVLIYLACVALIALPMMIAETLIGRTAQRSPLPTSEPARTRSRRHAAEKTAAGTGAVRSTRA
jgi:neurotransmitter:Na+ symporter, NSS family